MKMVPMIWPAPWVPRVVEVLFKSSKMTKLIRESNSSGRGSVKLLPAPSPVDPGTGTDKIRFVVEPCVIDVLL